jgi:hypothetical protein
MGFIQNTVLLSMPVSHRWPQTCNLAGELLQDAKRQVLR